ncbi:hypothetical protein [Phenylobacterium sp.]|uniref:hypothetical protein n=1 Tax=Phenylobacterium sp. TaxID=1871053 RepID=UPI002E2F5944|nr:hypothetical protein [Phenylobacterium sp.]HEX3364394.1 hypothetical protein [Phenylobacterium sp.]
MNATEASDPMVLRHALNNLFGKILGAAELAQDATLEPAVRAELDTIIHLAEEGGEMIADLGSAPAPA